MFAWLTCFAKFAKFYLSIELLFDLVYWFDITNQYPLHSSGASSTHAMTSPTAAISTEHVDKSLPGSTDSGTDSTGTTKSDQTTLPDHDNMHAGTLDTATTPEKGTTPTDGKYAEVKTI